MSPTIRPSDPPCPSPTGGTKESRDASQCCHPSRVRRDNQFSCGGTTKPIPDQSSLVPSMMNHLLCQIDPPLRNSVAKKRNALGYTKELNIKLPRRHWTVYVAACLSQQQLFVCCFTVTYQCTYSKSGFDTYQMLLKFKLSFSPISTRLAICQARTSRSRSDQ